MCTCTGLGLRVMLARLTGRPLEHRPDCPTRRPRFAAGGIVTRPLVAPLPCLLEHGEHVVSSRALPPYARGGAQ